MALAEIKCLIGKLFLMALAKTFNACTRLFKIDALADFVQRCAIGLPARLITTSTPLKQDISILLF